MSNIILTGASRSLGKSIYYTLKSEGHKVFGVGLGGPEKTEDFAHRYPKEWSFGGRMAKVTVAEAANFFGGPPDVLINNAGMTRINFIEDQSEVDWEAVMHVNLTVPYLLSQAMVQSVIEHKHQARVINITSMGYRYSLRASTAYCASKAGLDAVTRQMAKECANRLPITFFSVAPGSIESTDMINHVLDEMVEKRGFTREAARAYTCNVPMNRMAWMEEVMRVIKFAAFNAPEYMSGHAFELAGAIGG